MLALKFFKTSQIPNVIEPSSVYLVPGSLAGTVDIYVSNTDGTNVLKTIGQSEVEAIVATKVTEILSQSTQVISKVYEFSATLELRIDHNLNTTNYTYTIVNVNGDKVWTTDSNIDPNGFTLNFTEEEAGTISVVFYVNNTPQA